MALVTLRSYRDPIDAELAKVQLESADIPALVLDAQTVGVQWLYSVAIGGVRVQVDEADLARAREVLSEDHSADLAGIPENEAAPSDDELCPECGSPEVKPSRMYRIAAAFSLWSGIPIPIGKHRWVCRACGHAWKRLPDPHAEVSPVTLEAERAVHERRSHWELAAIAAALIGLIVLSYVKYRIDHPD